LFAVLLRSLKKTPAELWMMDELSIDKMRFLWKIQLSKRERKKKKV
jgi:hypothetical protein